MPNIKSQRLLIRNFTTADAAFIKELLNSPGWLKNIGDREIKTEEDAANFISNSLLPHHKSHGFGMWAFCTLDGTPMGMVGLIKRSYLEVPDLGFAILPEYYKLGYTQEAAQSILGLAKEKYLFNKILAICNSNNLASQHLLVKLGFSANGLVEVDGENLKQYKIVF